jgi:hypothetical protein
VTLSPVSDSATVPVLQVTTQEAPLGIGEFFEFQDVEFGSAIVSIEDRDEIQWRENNIRIGPRTQNVHFSGRVKSAFKENLYFDVKSAGSGNSIDVFDSGVWKRSFLFQNKAKWFGDGSYEIATGKIRWAVRADGFKIATGDETSIDRIGRRQRIQVTLKPGWGALFRAETSEHVPIEGATIQLDGSVVAKTDETGTAIVNTEVNPRTIRVLHPSWIPEWSSAYDLATGEVRSTGGLEKLTWFRRP